MGKDFSVQKLLCIKASASKSFCGQEELLCVKVFGVKALVCKIFCVKRALCVKVSVCESFFAYQLLSVKAPLC